MTYPDDYDPDFPEEPNDDQSVGVAIGILLALLLGFAALVLA